MDQSSAASDLTDGTGLGAQELNALLDSARMGLMRCRVLFDEGAPADLLCLSANDALRRLAGARDVVNRKLSEVLPGLAEGDPELLEFYARVVRTGQPARREAFVESLDRWFEVSAHSLGGDDLVAVIDVITERKRAEGDLQRRLELQDRFEKLAISVPGAIFTFQLRSDGSMCLPFGTARFAEIWGIDADTLHEDFSPALAAMHEGDADRIRSGILESAASMQVWHDAFRVLHPTKGEVWLEGQSVPKHDRDGSTTWYGFVQDITERKRAEEALAASEARLNFALEKSRTGGWEADLQSCNVRRTSQHDRIFGYESPRSEWTLETFFDHVLPDDSESTRRIMRSARETGTDFDIECRIRRVDGAVRWVRTAGGQVLDSSGRAVRTVGVIQDITDRKVEAEEVQALSRRLRAALGSITDVVVITDTEGRIVESNDSFVAFHRFGSREECPTGPAEFRELIELTTAGGAPVPHERWPVPLALSGVTSTNVEYWLRRKDTGDTWVGSFSFAPVRDEAGVVVGSIVVARDVTDDKRAEQALRDSEERFLRAFRASPASQVIGRVDDDSIVEVNAAFCALVGYERREMLGRTAAEIGFWGDPGRVRREVAALAQGEQIRGWELVLNTRSGESRAVVGSIDPIEWKGESCVITALTDITEIKKAEAALRESEERFRSLVEGAPEAVFVRTGENFAYLNEAAIRLFGAESGAQLLGQSAIERFHPDCRPAVRERIRIQDDTGERTRSVERVLLRLDGLEIPAIISTVPIVYEGLSSSLVFAQDFTEQRHVLDELSDSEERFRALADGAPDGIFIQTGMRFRYLNQAMAEILGVERPSELVGVDAMSFVPPEYVDHVLERIRFQRETGSTAPPVEQEYLRVDGTRVPVETTAVPFRFGGEPANLVFVRDRTERRKAEQERANLEEQLLQAQKMESIGQLAGGVAHDFNNLLMVQKGYCELMRSTPLTEEALAEGLAQVERCTDRASELTRQLLAFSRRQTLQPVVFDLNELVGHTAEMLGRLISEDVRLVADLAPVPAMISADRGQIEQVLTNLAINARDAMPEGGVLAIQVGFELLDNTTGRYRPELVPGPYVVLGVSDTGQGMDAGTQRRIFEPFFTTKAEGKGTGLGLSTVYGIVHQSGGDIRVSSHVGRGTTFKVYLPQVQPRSASASDREVETLPGDGELVLLVEDEPALRQLAVLMMERLGYKVIDAANGEEALALIHERNTRPDLVLTDVVIPGMSGRVLVERLREAVPDVKVIYMSGYTDDAVADRGVIGSGVNFLQKPFTMTALAAMIKTALGRPA